MTIHPPADLGPLEDTAGRPREARLGLVVLSTDMVIEAVFRDMLGRLGPDDPPVAGYVNRIAFKNPVTMASLAAMESDLDRCVGDILPGQRLDVVAFGCSSGAVAIGEETLAARIAAVKPGAVTTNPVMAARTAFAALGVTRISILTPYSDDVNANVAGYFSDHGLTIEAIDGFDVPDDADVARITPQSMMRGAETVMRPETEALFLSCTALRAAEHAARFEAQFKVPVVTSNQALAWHALRLAGVDAAVPGYGRLLQLQIAA